MLIVIVVIKIVIIVIIVIIIKIKIIVIVVIVIIIVIVITYFRTMLQRFLVWLMQVLPLSRLAYTLQQHMLHVSGS